MSSDIIPKFRVAIVYVAINTSFLWRLNFTYSGCGIGGLTLARALTKGSKDIKVDIYEASPQPSEISLGAGIWRMPVEVLKGLGFGEISNNSDVPTDEHNSKYRI